MVLTVAVIDMGEKSVVFMGRMSGFYSGVYF